MYTGTRHRGFGLRLCILSTSTYVTECCKHRTVTAVCGRACGRIAKSATFRFSLRTAFSCWFRCPPGALVYRRILESALRRTASALAECDSALVADLGTPVFRREFHALRHSPGVRVPAAGSSVGIPEGETVHSAEDRRRLFRRSVAS